MTSPSDVMIMPVPSSSLLFDLTSIETTAWMTLSTSCGMVTLPLSTAAPGAALLSWITALPALSLLLLLLLSASATTPAPTPPPMSAATSATGSQERKRPGAPGAGGGAIPGTVGSTGGAGYVNGFAGGVPAGRVEPIGASAGGAGGQDGGG